MHEKKRRSIIKTGIKNNPTEKHPLGRLRLR